MNSQDKERLDKIRHDRMLLFEESVGYEFRVHLLTDIIVGVDWKYMHVKGQTYGNFHVDLCELTGGTEDYRNHDTYIIDLDEETGQRPGGEPRITCRVCGKTSYNKVDVEKKYCGHCHRFHSNLM